ncbi:hypothetical protein KJ910_00635, partial [Patescibacteria group bacterium]|nr:hypothetical protein [Patescibacteria group bacterium]
MDRYNKNKKRILGSVFLVFFLVTIVFSGVILPTKPAQAGIMEGAAAIAARLAGGGMPVDDIAQKSGDVQQLTDEELLKKPLTIVLKTVLINLLSFVLNRLAYDAAVYLAAGATGQEPSFQYKNAGEYFEDLGLDIAGAHMDALNDVLAEVDIQFDVCAPEDPILRLGLQLGIRSAFDRPEPDCDFRDMIKNWQATIASFQRYAELGENPSEYFLTEFRKAYRPGANELSASIGIAAKVNNDVLTAKTTNFWDSLMKSGYKDVEDPITGNVTTPAALIEEKTKEELVRAKKDQTAMNWDAVTNDKDMLASLGITAGSVFLNTFISEALYNIYNGIFDADVVETDPFNPEYVSVGGIEAAEEKFKELLTADIISLDNFSPVSELLACPGYTARNVYNCAMDSNLAAAFSRAETGQPMTIDQALEEGLLNGAWPLVPSDDRAKNQDPYCYTYGYCYGNLVKMRKFRLIPVGFELAANSPWNSEANPITLQGVVDSFDDCSPEGKANVNHPWCHLIDTNWVLKAPETFCPASAPGELVISSNIATRLSYCTDTPSCIAEDDNGNCIGGEGYCTREQNIWRFRGDDCPEQYASCLSFQNTDTRETGDWLLNTVDFDSCNQTNAGCMWYRTQKAFDDLGTVDDTDDAYVWLATGDDFVTAERDDDLLSSISTEPTYGYDTDADGTDDYSYSLYAYEDRRYFNTEILECSEEDAGCTELIEQTDDVVLNLVANPSFENDENGDGAPDGWHDFDAAGYLEDNTGSVYGVDMVQVGFGGTGSFYQEVSVTPNTFYTFSFYAFQEDATPSTINAQVQVYDELGVAVDLAGTNIDGDCYLTGIDNNTLRVDVIDPGEDTVRYECTFTTTADVDNAKVEFSTFTNFIYVDAVQLEEGAVANYYQEGYGSSNLLYSYLKMPPDYLGCTGAASDPSECDNYAQMCTAVDVGCELYTPVDGDPAVPAIIAEIDECPSECAGYAPFKQEATRYETEKNPLFFIPETAQSCSESAVGCDEFTNLDTLAAGGEGLEYYTYLRACTKAENTTAEGTFFTWEGSDQNGYQLMSYDLLKSNLNSTNLAFASGFTEADMNDAPCVNPILDSESTLVCDDINYSYDIYFGTAALMQNETCDGHDDIVTNPDCREFYDSDGAIHYREFSDTATITDDCHPYRKSESDPTDADGDLKGDDCESSGGFWTVAGECRYLGYPDESTTCGSGSNGCRSYTGGAGRNATTIFTDDVEDGSLSEWGGFSSVYTANATISNESVAVDGHSINVTNNGYLSTLYIEEAAVDGCAAGEFCELTDEATGTTCEVIGDSAESEIDYCGPLTGALVQGKTYIFSFWAKGTGELIVRFVDHGGTDDPHNFQDFNADPVELTTGWQLYEVGPLDTSDAGDFADFDDTAVLQIYNSTGEFYIDNLQLKEAEDNITVVKDSWVTPSTCDMTPEGAASPQYYLGCEEYSDRAGDDHYLYRFTRLCGEDVIGCSGFFDTQNNESTYTQVYNAQCRAVYDDAGYSVYIAYNNDDVIDANEGYCSNDATKDCALHDDCVTKTGYSEAKCVAPDALACNMLGINVCTIAPGAYSCNFDWDGNLPVDLPDNIVVGPETVIVPNDTLRYVVDDGSASCSGSDKGCTEFGLPTFNQDKSEVTEFESAYYYDLPDQYADQLCTHEALFCAEYSTNQDGNFYFKDPFDQLCEWKESVTISSQGYYGWFRNGSNEPCYWEDVDGDGTFIPSNDSAYLIAGDMFGIWHNGDTEYDNWVGECAGQYDRCTEFVDVTDTGEGDFPSGTPYYYLKNDKLDEDNLSSGDQCNGQVSQREGCALFFDSSTGEQPDWNASASYIATVHADDLFGDAPHSPQDPIDCGNEQGGEFVDTHGNSVDLCEDRCKYPVYTGVNFTGHTGVEFEYTDSCYVDSDCTIITDDFGNDVGGSCTTVTERLTNDVNTIQKVYRDRECAEWLSAVSSGYAWDERIGSYVEVTDHISACNEYSSLGTSAFCVGFPENDPDPLSLINYSARDVTWFGQDYSGYSIPEMLPVEYLYQYNINPGKWCKSVGEEEPEVQVVDNQYWPVACADQQDCDDAGFPAALCQTADQDFRLAYQPGSCDEEYGAECVVGICSDDSSPCTADAECDSGSCLIGECKRTDLDSSCIQNSDCTTNPGFDLCENGLCVERSGDTCPPLLTCGEDQDIDGDGSIDIDAECDYATGAFMGRCLNGGCTVDVYGDPFEPDTAEEIECRGYPEQDSPYSHEVVEHWMNPEDRTDATSDYWQPQGGGIYYDATPSDMTTGYEGVNTCTASAEDCMCTYNKASYGSGAVNHYFDVDLSREEASAKLPGVCYGGENSDMGCTQNTDCGDSGTCMKLDTYNLYRGWEGYCLERDTQVNLFGQENGDGVCLTWLPVDQLIGAANIYAQFTEAGYPLVDTYYCAESGWFRDFYVTGAQMNADGEITGIIPACAESLRSTDNDQWEIENVNHAAGCEAEYDSCWYQAFCPQGYVALVGYCDDGGNAATYCDGTNAWNEGAADDDCPYFCVPENSYTYDTGRPCTDIYGSWDRPSEWVGQHGYGGPGSDPGFYPDESRFGTPVYLANGLDNNINSDLMKCVARGVPISSDFYSQDMAFGSIDWLTQPTNVFGGGLGDAYDEHDTYYVWGRDYTELAPRDEGFYNLEFDDTLEPNGRGAAVSYQACYAVAQVATTGEDGNKAWTNRTWINGDYTTTSVLGFSDPLNYRSDDVPAPGYKAHFLGDAGFYEADQGGDNEYGYRVAEFDSYPMEVLDTFPMPVYYSGGSAVIDPDDGAAKTYPSIVQIPAAADASIEPWALAHSYEDTNYGTDYSTPQDYIDYNEQGDSNWSDINNDSSTLTTIVSQFFAKVYNLFIYDWNRGDDDGGVDWDTGGDSPDDSGLGRYVRWNFFNDDIDGDFSNFFDSILPVDISEAGDGYGSGPNAGTPSGPTTISVGSCDGSLCYEENDGKFSINGVDNQNIVSGGGREHTTLKFFATTNPNQFPIRQITIDWGDDI